MDFDFKKQFDFYVSLIESMNPFFAAIFLISWISIWFLPSILAIFFNRSNVGKIFMANIPAGLSWVVWSALIFWAFTGRIKNDYVKKSDEDSGGGL